MFSLSDVIAVAITIEENGEATYRQAAEGTARTDVAALLTWLADQEAEHVTWFRELGAEAGVKEADADLADMGQSMLKRVVGEESFNLDPADLASKESLHELLDVASQLEMDTAIFYQLLGGFVNDSDTLAHLETIIEEEKSHGRMLLELLESDEVPDYESDEALAD